MIFQLIKISCSTEVLTVAAGFLLCGAAQKIGRYDLFTKIVSYELGGCPTYGDRIQYSSPLSDLFSCQSGVSSGKFSVFQTSVICRHI